MRSSRLVLLLGFALVAAACSSTDTSAATTGEATEDEAIETESPTEAPSAAPTEATTEVPETTASLTSDEIRETLDPQVSSASQTWPTDWTTATIDLTELRAGLRGTDTRDGIPPIDNPKYESVTDAAEWLNDNEPGALVQVDDGAWFFPLSIMTSHEIVNDTLNDVPVAVTFCPLCNTAIAYDRRVGDDVLRFGVSGLLRMSDLVMWDDLTTSLWQQITGEGVVGEHAGVQLTPVSTAIVSFGQFRDGFPDGLSLSRDTGFGRNYGQNPYEQYSSRNSPIGAFFQGDPDPRLPALSRVVGVTTPTTAQAYPFEALTVERVVNDTIDDQPIAIFWGGDTADALDDRSMAESAAIGTAVAYSRMLGDRELTFEPSGEDFRDVETGSVWNILGQAISGELAGEKLNTVTHRNEFWFAFAGFFHGADVYGL